MYLVYQTMTEWSRTWSLQVGRITWFSRGTPDTASQHLCLSPTWGNIRVWGHRKRYKERVCTHYPSFARMTAIKNSRKSERSNIKERLWAVYSHVVSLPSFGTFDSHETGETGVWNVFFVVVSFLVQGLKNVVGIILNIYGIQPLNGGATIYHLFGFRLQIGKRNRSTTASTPMRGFGMHTRRLHLYLWDNTQADGKLAPFFKKKKGTY